MISPHDVLVRTVLSVASVVGLAIGIGGCGKSRPTPQLGSASVDAGASPASSKRPGTWRIETPQPTSTTLTGIWASSPTDLYAVGDGVVLHGDGSGHWTIRAHGKEVAGLSAIWGSSATDIYAVGNAGILHSTDGARWVSVTPNNEDAASDYTAIWGSSADDIYVTGLSTVHSTDRGKTWKDVAPATRVGRFSRVFGRTAKDVWLVGQEQSARPYSAALILHSSDNGKTWQTQRRDTNFTTGIVTFFANDKVALALPALTEEMLLRSANGGRTWQSVKTTGLSEQKPSVITGSGADLYLAMSSGKVLKSVDTGTSWRPAAGETGLATGEEDMIRDLSVIGDSLYAVGFGGVILRSSAGAPWVVEAGSLLDKDLKAVWGTAAKNVYAAGEDGVIVRSTDEGATWRDLSPPRKAGANSAARYAGIWGSGPSDIYIVGAANLSDALILHSTDGTTFVEQSAPGAVDELVAVWGSDADHVYAASLHEILGTTDRGSSWHSVWKNPGARLTRITGGGGSLWASGWDDKSTSNKLHPLLIESTDGGASWHEVSGKLTTALQNIWRTKRGTLLGVGGGPRIHRSVDHAQTWSEEPIPFEGHMEAIGGSTTDDADEVFATGFNGVLFQGTHNGTSWEKIDTGLDWTRALHAIWVSPEGDVFVVGDAGLVLHRR